MRTSTLLLAFCVSGALAGSAPPALAAKGSIENLTLRARLMAHRVIDHVTPGGRKYLAAMKIERSRGAEAALLAQYGHTAEHERNVWTNKIELRRDNSSAVDTAVVTQHLQHPVQLVTDVAQLLDKDVEQRLRSMGFQGRRDGNRLSMALAVHDPEVKARLGYAQTDRYAQRVSVDYGRDNPVAAYVSSYSFPPRGMPGMNEENIRHSVLTSGKTEVARVLLNTSLGRTIALPLGVGMDFYETTLNRSQR